MQTVEYAPGRLADVFGDQGQPTVLLWHGMQTDARAAVRTLAGLVADRGLAVVAPDWNSQADDDGRDDLLRSARFAQQWGLRSEGLVVVGWSMGGLAAAGLAIAADRLAIRVRHTICLAGAFTATDPIFGNVPARALPDVEPGPPFTLLHGAADDVVPVSASRDFAGELLRYGWQAEFVEIDADHASIACARYDPVAGQYSAADDVETISVATDVVARIAAALD